MINYGQSFFFFWRSVVQPGARIGCYFRCGEGEDQAEVRIPKPCSSVKLPVDRCWRGVVGMGVTLRGKRETRPKKV